MGMPAMATEQYPKGLGPTVPEIALEKYGIKAFPKTCFTMALPELLAELKERQPDTKSILLCGIETQACIHHTTLDLLERGFETSYHPRFTFPWTAPPPAQCWTGKWHWKDSAR